MLRLYKDTIRYLLACAAALKTMGGEESLSKILMTYWFKQNQYKSISPTLNEQLELFMERNQHYPMKMDDVMLLLTDVLTQGHLDGDKDLIDVIVGVLKSPYPHNTLSGKTLEKLNRAILL